MELNENRSSEAVKAIEFTDRKVGGLVLRHIDKGEDIILQLNKGSTSLPDHSGAMMAKALIDTFGKNIMERVVIERMSEKWIEGGSIYVRMLNMNTLPVKSIMYPTLLESLEESMQEA